jgi:hypothetical protein
MAAAEITPTIVQKSYVPSIDSTGTPVRIVEYLLKATKTAEADWIVFGTYISGTYLGATGSIIDGSGDGSAATITYTATGTKINIAGSAGTAYLRVLVQEA